MRGRVFAFVFTVILGFGGGSAVAPRTANAWYFPEHVVLAEDGHAALAPEIRTILADAVADARREGLAICERTELRLDDVLTHKPLVTRTLRSPASVPCIPYSALSGLAGDHASDVAELRTVLTTAKGLELVSAVAYEWRRFRDHVARGQTTLDRMSYVHDLDVALYFIDATYAERARATRSHFRDNGRSFETVLRQLATEGRIDELLERFVFHHVRSLVLAAASKRVEALLEHAFALHFLQDAFASGHLVMSDAAWNEGRDSVRFRHDAFNAEGLTVTRAMSHEPCASLAVGTLELAGLPPCWTTTGDGYLGLDPGASDRVHAAAALVRADLAFAIALDPDRMLAYATNLGELELLALASKLDPMPWWTVDRAARRTLPAGPEHAMRIVRRAIAAVPRLRALKIPAAAGVAVIRHPGAVDPAIISGILDAPALGPTADDDETTNDASRARPAAAIGATLVRPILAQWPSPERDTAKVQPPGHLDHGWALQLFAATAASVLVPPAAPVDFFGPGASVSVGFAYRWGSLLPGRRGRSIAEFSLGFSETLHVDANGNSGRGVNLTLLDQELRWPVLWEALTTYNLPLDIAGMHRAGRVLVFNGIRAHEVVRNGSLLFLGAEIEALAIALSDGHGTHPFYVVSPDVRFYLGAARPSTAQPAYPDTLGFTFGITLTGGYVTFL